MLTSKLITDDLIIVQIMHSWYFLIAFMVICLCTKWQLEKYERGNFEEKHVCIWTQMGFLSGTVDYFSKFPPLSRKFQFIYNPQLKHYSKVFRINIADLYENIKPSNPVVNSRWKKYCSLMHPCYKVECRSE